MQTALAANPGKTDTTERRPQISQEPAIHPRNSHIHLLSHPVSTLQISRPHGSCQTVLRIIPQADRFFFRIERRDMTNRPEKPHPAVFEAALKQMKADPADSLYVGDLYSVDYVGARKAGMDAVLFDVAGAYRDKEFPRVASLAELQTWLDK